MFYGFSFPLPNLLQRVLLQIFTLFPLHGTTTVIGNNHSSLTVEEFLIINTEIVYYIAHTSEKDFLEGNMSSD